MKAGQYMDAGVVCAEIINSDTDTVLITYDTTGTTACLEEVQAYIGNSIPVAKDGNPRIGNFPAKSLLTGTCVKTHSMTAFLSPDCKKGAEFANNVYKLAAHASVQFIGGTQETAWSTGKPITPGGSWATYSEVILSCKCLAPTKLPTKAPTKKPTKVS
jgi:hypothetical protein